MNYSEQEYNLLPIKKNIDQLISKLGINIPCWYYGEATQGDDYFNVYFSNIKLEDHTLSFDYLLRNGK